MSTIKTAKVQTGISNTPANNFHTRAPDDGTWRLTRGNSEAPLTDVISVNPSGAVDFPGGLARGVPQSLELLWSGNAGNAGTPLVLSRPLVSGDILWLLFTDAAQSNTPCIVVTAERMVANAIWGFTFGQSGFALLQYDNASQLTINSLSAGYPIGRIYASKARL